MNNEVIITKRQRCGECLTTVGEIEVIFCAMCIIRIGEYMVFIQSTRCVRTRDFPLLLCFPTMRLLP